MMTLSTVDGETPFRAAKSKLFSSVRDLGPQKVGRKLPNTSTYFDWVREDIGSVAVAPVASVLKKENGIGNPRDVI